MAVKTITIDLEAYDALVRMKKAGESFSKVIKKTMVKEGKTAGNLLENLDRIGLSADTLDHVEELVKSRKDTLVNSPRWDKA